MKLIKSVLTISLILVSSVYAEDDIVDRSGSVGLSTAIQSNQLDIMIPIWASKDIVLTPSISYVNVSDYQSDLGLGASLRYNFYSTEFVPYFGVRVGMLKFTPDGGESITDKFYGALFGGEYFLKDKLSIGIEAQLNITSSDENSSRFGNPDGTTMNTASRIYASVYF